MSTPSTALALWDNGRLARRPSHRFELTRDRAIGAALLAASAVVFAAYVAVLEQDVHRGALQQAELRERQVAEAQCEMDRPAESRSGCLALLAGEAPSAVAAADVVPTNTAYLSVAATGLGAQ